MRAFAGLDVAVGGVEQRVDLRGPRGRGRELRGVEVEAQAEDRLGRRARLDKRAQGLLADVVDGAHRCLDYPLSARCAPRMVRPVTDPARNSLLPRRRIDPRQELPALKLAGLAPWRGRDVFAASLRAREGAEPWVFYEGPPTANGPPGAHHVLSRVFKDIYPRFQTMRGYRVERKGGWDCHGLPVEIAVEQKLGITSKAEIEEKIGIERFNAECRASVFEYVEDWNRLTERIG